MSLNRLGFMTTFLHGYIERYYHPVQTLDPLETKGLSNLFQFKTDGEKGGRNNGHENRVC